ncbi:hypothetical protein NBRC116494_30540 [Aurantivibrio plasticivorans]
MDAFIKPLFLITLVVLSAATENVDANDTSDPLLYIEAYYREIHPLDDEKLKRNTLKGLLDEISQAPKISNDNPAKYFLSMGLLTAAYAETRGMKGLGDLKRARGYLMESITQDQDLLDGYAQAFLARLFCTLPGWPISWGNQKECNLQLETGLKNHSTGLAINLYSGLREIEDHKPHRAIDFLSAASHADFPKKAYPNWYAALYSQVEIHRQDQ